MNELIPTAFTASLKKLIERDIDAAKSQPEAERVLNRYADGIEFYKNQFSKISDPKNRAHAVHQHIDRSFAELLERQPSLKKEISCGMGCAHCCHNPVVANEEEAELLLEFCKEEKIKVDWERVMEQAKFQGSDHEYFLQPKSKSRCVFLGEGDLCSVYEHRPASCRKYFVGSTPIDCDDRVGKQQVAVLADTQSELAASGLMDIDHNKVGLLPKMLFQAQMNRPAHCNYCQKETETKEWDCTACGLSKGHPHGD